MYLREIIKRKKILTSCLKTTTHLNISLALASTISLFDALTLLLIKQQTVKSSDLRLSFDYLPQVHLCLGFDNIIDQTNKL